MNQTLQTVQSLQQKQSDIISKIKKAKDILQLRRVDITLTKEQYREAMDDHVFDLIDVSNLFTDLIESLSKSVFDLQNNIDEKNMLENIVVIGGRSTTTLTDSICSALKINKARVRFADFANTEISIKIQESVRGKDIFIIETGAPYENRSINDHVIETNFLLDCCKRSGAKSITLFLACFPYARGDKKEESRNPISASCMMIDMFSKADRIVTIDLHSSQIQGFTTKPTDNLYAIKIFCDYLRDSVFKDIVLNGENINDHFVLVAPDCGAVKRIDHYSQKLSLNHAILTKSRDYKSENVVLTSTLLNSQFVVGKTAIIIDDIADTMGTMLKAIDELIKFGTKDVIIIVTHGVLSNDPSGDKSKDAVEKINNCPHIKNVIVTNSIPQDINILRCPKLTVLDIGPLFAKVIHNLMTGESISDLFN